MLIKGKVMASIYLSLEQTFIQTTSGFVGEVIAR
jgi:hypothetical protein